VTLDGRTALVTGAGNGLGKAITLTLAASGARVLLVGRQRGKLAKVAAEIGPAARIGVCDTSDEAAVAALATEFADEQVSIVVNNAGIGGPVAPLIDISAAEWDEVLAVNVRGVFLICRAFLPPMIARGFPRRATAHGHRGGGRPGGHRDAGDAGALRGGHRPVRRHDRSLTVRRRAADDDVPFPGLALQEPSVYIVPVWLQKKTRFPSGRVSSRWSSR
jgi:NAD(P)-dependent dehydrogenase (short-subunit alcohol dehydrogenase family)